MSERIARQIEHWNAQPLEARRRVFNALEFHRDWGLSRPDLDPELASNARAFDALIALVETLAMEPVSQPRAGGEGK